MPESNWTLKDIAQWGVPNAGFGNSANTWNIPGYDPARDTIPPIQSQIDRVEETTPPVTWIAKTYDDYPFENAQIYGVKFLPYNSWEGNVTLFEQLVIACIDLEGLDHTTEMLAKTEGLIKMQVPAGELIYSFLGFADASTEVPPYILYEKVSGHQLTYVSGPSDPIPLGTEIGISITPLVREIPSPILRTTFHSTAETNSQPGLIALDAVPVNDDWSAPPEQFRSLKVHRTDSHNVDHSGFFNSLGLGVRVRLTHPNGVSVFRITDVAEFDPDYILDIEFESGSHESVGVGTEIALDFLVGV